MVFPAHELKYILEGIPWSGFLNLDNWSIRNTCCGLKEMPKIILLSGSSGSSSMISILSFLAKTSIPCSVVNLFLSSLVRHLWAFYGYQRFPLSFSRIKKRCQHETEYFFLFFQSNVPSESPPVISRRISSHAPDFSAILISSTTEGENSDGYFCRA